MADPITAAIAVITKIVVAVYTAYQASAAIRAVVQIALFVATMAASKKAAKKAAKIDQGQELALKLDPNMPRQIAVGRVATGGSQVFAGTFTDNAKVPNKYLYRVIDLSDRPITGCVAVIEDGAVLSFLDDVHTSFARCNQHKNASGGWCMWVHIEKGSDSPTALSWLITNSGGQWTSAHKGKGIAYAVVQLAYDQDAFPNGEPQLSFVLDGATIYDPRDGAQSVSTPSTWTYSRNAALLTSQLLIGFKTGNVLLAGAGADSRDIEPASWVAAANTCDIAIPLAVGGTEPQYTAGMMVTSSNSTEDDLSPLVDAMDGSLFDRGGLITLWPGGTRTPTLDLTDDDVIWSEEKSFQPYSALSNLYNVVSGTFVAADLLYVEDSYPVKINPAFVTQDGGQRIVLNKGFRASTSRTQVQRATLRLLNSSRFQKVIGFVGPLWLFELEQGDWFTLTSARWGFTTKYFVVQSVGYTVDLKVGLVAIETSPTVNGWTTANEVARTNTNTSQAGYALPEPDITLTAVTIADSGTYMSLPAIRYVISAPDGSFGTGYKVQLRVQGSGTSYDLQPLALGQMSALYSSGLLPGITYEMRVQAYEGIQSSTWSSWKAVTTSGIYKVSDAGSLLDVDGQTVLDSIDDALQMAEDASSDGVLTPDEKRYTLQPLLSELRGERDSGARVQAVGWSLSTSAFDTAMSTLETYLSTQLTTPTAYNVYTGNTTIPTPATYQTNLTSAVNQLQILRKSVSTEAATRALATKTTYTGGATVDSLKPAEAGSDITGTHTAVAITGQTVWATYTNMVPSQVVTPGANLIFDGGLKLKAQGWNVPAPWTWGSYPSLGGYVQAQSDNVYGLSPRFAVIASTAHTVQTMTYYNGAYSTPPQIYIAWYTAADVYINETTHTNVAAGLQLKTATGIAPSNAVWGRFVMYSGIQVPASGAQFVVTKVKGEYGSSATVFSDDATSGALYANGVNIDTLMPGEIGSNVTETRTAAAVAGQGALATLNQAVWATNVTGVGKPEDYATKSIVTRSMTAPTTGNTVNDIWVELNGGGIAIAMYAWNGSGWVNGADRTIYNVASAVTGQGPGATMTWPTYAGNADALAHGLVPGNTYLDSTNGNKLTTVTGGGTEVKVNAVAVSGYIGHAISANAAGNLNISVGAGPGKLSITVSGVSLADNAGNPSYLTAIGSGSIKVNGTSAGSIGSSGGLGAYNEDVNGTPRTVSGIYSISATGTVNVELILTGGGGGSTDTGQFNGTMTVQYIQD